MPPDLSTDWLLRHAGPDAPNLPLARALATFTPTLAFKVVNCWRPPFQRPCRFRFCPACARYRQRRLAKVYEAHLTTMVAPFFLTLTRPIQPGTPLTRWCLTRFRKRLSSLRRWRRFRRSVRGGFYTIEIALNKDGNWNIHAHLVLDVVNLSLTKPAIKAAWHWRTGAIKVEFEPIKAGTLGWVFGYTTKPQEPPTTMSAGTAVDALARPQEVPLDPDRLRELYEATRRFRNSQSFGSFHHQYGKLPMNRQGRGRPSGTGGSR